MYFLILLLFQASLDIPFVQPPEKQELDERIYKELTYSNSWEITLEEVYTPGIVSYSNGYIYILDYRPSPRVLKIDSIEGVIKTQYGTGQGGGPGDISQPTDFTVTPNGSIWVTDYGNSRISVFDSSGEPGLIIVDENIPYKIASQTDSKEVMVASYASSKIYAVDENENVHWESGKLTTKNHSMWNNILSSFVAQNDDNSTFQVGNYAGYIATYNNQGELTNLRQTIDHDHNPIGNAVSGTDELIYSVNRDNLDYAIATGVAIGNKLVLLVQHYGENEHQTLDVYSTSNSSYLYSYKLEESFRDIHITNNGVLIGLKPESILHFYKLNDF